MRALTYSRVSTLHDQDPQSQVETLRSYCASRKWSVVEEVVDHGFSGGTEKRPGLKRVMELVRSRQVDVIIVTKLDRMARSLRHLVTLLDELRVLKVEFVSVGDHIDLTTASGRLMLHIIGAFAEFERALIRERTMAGLAHAVKKGKRLGRPRVRDDRAILKLRSDGLTYMQIQRKLGVSRGAVCRSINAGSKSSLKSIEPNSSGES